MARTRVPCIGRQTPNHCATREAPTSLIFSSTLISVSLLTTHSTDTVFAKVVNDLHVIEVSGLFSALNLLDSQQDLAHLTIPSILKPVLPLASRTLHSPGSISITLASLPICFAASFSSHPK